VLVDGAQSVPHFPVDVQDLDCDFFVFSGHKMYAPTGSGVVFGKREWLDKMPPYQTGGGMIRSVTFEKTTYAPIPEKFEAGTPAIAAGIGLGAAIDYINSIDFAAAAAYEDELLNYATRRLADVPGVKLIGTADKRASVLSFTIENVHPHDIGTILDQEGIAIRAGHHCAQPVMQFFDVPATARASFAFYNTREEADKLADAVQKVIEVFA
jgi:cysteine desulfurase/selenocysteine lyase